MSEPRIIKRYTNRKLYDTKDSRYVTLSQIASMVRAGEDMTVIDNASKEDLTSLTLAQIIYEQEKKQAEVLPLSALRELVRRSEARLADLRDGRVGRLLTRAEVGELEQTVEKEIPDTAPAALEELEMAPPVKLEEEEANRGLLNSSRLTLEEWQRRVDEQLKTLLDSFAPFSQLQEEIRRVSQQIEELEARIRKLTHMKKQETDPESSDENKKEKDEE